ncbi:MAG: hypothetical protein FJ290_08485 [Planctomycetes bacterium]|nr:hypothetical protein [Planctomycetota bacterium]
MRPERFTRLVGLDIARTPGRDDSFQMYLRTVTLPSKDDIGFRRGPSNELDLTLHWVFGYFRRGDPKAYFKAEEKKVRLTFLSE